MKIDPRFLTEDGRQIFTGSELLVKGALETTGGVHLLTGYPGSPIAGFFDAIESLGPMLNEKGVVAKIANNEALSVAMVNGAQMAGLRAITAFKSVGLHVAADALALGTLCATKDQGGGVIVCGDDPWSDSTQVPVDSRFLAEHLRMPMLEPACPQEIKDWINVAFSLGQVGHTYIGYMMTVAMADGGGTVECHPNQFPKLNEHQKISLSYEKDILPNVDQTVLLPPRSWQREITLDQRFNAIKAEARRLGVNRILNKPQKDEIAPIGFVASGVAFAYLNQALTELGLACRLPVLKLGLSYPVDEQIVTEFASQCKQLVVVEERRSFVERQIIDILNPLRQAGKLNVEILGKQFGTDEKGQPIPGIPDTRGLNPSLLAQRLIPMLRNHPTLPPEMTNGKLTAALELIDRTGSYEVNLPLRTPSFCPGCPHRDSASVLLELRKDFLDTQYMNEHHNRSPVDLVAHGDTGCYTLLMFEPTKPLMHNYSGMGLGGATGAGIDPFINNKQIVFMGDGTFYHSGQVALSQSINNGQDITYIILNNKTTAMTGHQVNPGDEVDLRGNKINALDIEKIIKGILPKQLKRDVMIVSANPADRDRYRKLLEQTILADGVKIIIADKECGIAFHRRARVEERKVYKQHGYLPQKTHMNVATEACEFCLECTNQTGCPGLTVHETDYGPKIQTDFSWCVDDGACQKINACPSFEQVTITRKQAPRVGIEHVDIENLPDPPRPIHADQEVWQCYLAGVGGMGIGLCTSILVSAGHQMGYHVQFLDKKGMAIRNGGVFSQLVFTRRDSDTPTTNGNGNSSKPSYFSTPVISYGKADLLLGIDLLEATRSLDPKLPYRVASSDHTVAVVNTARTPTILNLMGRDDFNPAQLEQTIKRYTKQDNYLGFNVGDLCERVLDSKLYANIMMLGMAYQKGYLPLTLESIHNAIRTLIRHETERNLRAFEIGRKIVVRPDLFVVEPIHEVESARKAFRRKVNTIKAQYPGKRGKQQSKQFRVLLKQTFRGTQGLRVDDQLVRDVIIRAYDCMVWGGIAYARAYCNRLVEVFQKDNPAHGYAITRAVVQNLAKVMLIKDEVYVSSLLTSPEKYRRDRRRYNVNPANGDKITYKHYNRPEFSIFGKRFQFEWHSRDWQLRIMAQQKWLRKFMPHWHERERVFRDWYMNLVDQMNWDGPRDYKRWHAILSSPANVSGYRNIRYPKMDAAKQQSERFLAMSPEEFELSPAPAERSVALPVMTTT